MGFAYWMEKIGAAASDDDFEAAAPVLARLAAGQPSDAAATLARLDALLKAYGPDSVRYYGVGAIALHVAAAGDKARLQVLAGRLAGDYTAAEQKLPVKKWGSTVAPAMIHFFKGEAERVAG